MRQYQMFINGRFVLGLNGSRTVLNPSTEEVVSEISEASIEQVDQAVQSAAQVQPSWARRPAIERAAYLRQISSKIRGQKESLARVISEEQGKVLALSRFEVEAAADYIDYMAEWARRYEGTILQSDRSRENIFLFKAPMGVVAGILPWNFPFFLIARKMAPALVTGNTIIIKPSEDTPNNAAEFARIVSETELPAGVFNLVCGAGETVGAALAAHPGIDFVTFTGSVKTGSRIMKAAADNITKVSLELGGKAPAIVMDDANLDVAVKAIHDSRVTNSGQVCNCAERVYVQEDIAAEFIKRMTVMMATTPYGDPLQDGVVMGPLINQEQLNKVAWMVEQAVKEGAKIATGGKKGRQAHGFYYEPTVLINCRQDMDVLHREIFGPVLPIVPFKTLDEAISMANDSDYGLTSSIYTQDLDVAMRACNELKFGETYVNRENSEAIQAFHSGWRRSGIGGDDGRLGLEEFLQTHAVYIQQTSVQN